MPNNKLMRKLKLTHNGLSPATKINSNANYKLSDPIWKDLIAISPKKYDASRTYI